MQFDIELIQHEYFCKCNFLKIIAISKWSGYVLFEFNPLVMVHSLSIQYLSRASNVKTSPLTTSMAKNFISLTLWPFEEKCWYSLGFSNSSSCTNLLCWPPLTIRHPFVFPAYWGLWLHLWHSIMWITLQSLQVIKSVISKISPVAEHLKSFLTW